ncbi:hypothetical protein TSTA_012060 [Talaromyces stipitatus ATCC 10500]|uniref:Transcription factor domain-containing protein n=1 Tax=Talaromyces stipitatus (strain ATCC 10500 / CBS 375.48 / QM 6759 / NRRL 1006) TaxID=441959 RepID=B8ME20_TALSN|nr:uncharacterized protein TSTA_012060 [Talaromyces stipitatus ATCC 10500]EED16097.1 hypothetical protein TSTA_012060 [Talaromyces stipitatus ATCC 10500]
MMQMMSLQTFDRTYSSNLTSNLRLSPLLSRETLRRLAWSTFYNDTIIDGGRYGFHTIDEKAYSIQLACDEASFLRNENVVTGPLRCNASVSANADSSNKSEEQLLDISDYLLRTAAARRRALHFAFRASHAEQTSEELTTELATIEHDMEEVINALPKEFHFNSSNMLLHRHRLITFILLHVIRHNLFIITGRAALHIYSQDNSTKADLISQIRRNRISHALPTARIVAEGLRAGIYFDPDVAVDAYVALESQDPAEYDFRDFRWAKLERLRRCTTTSTNTRPSSIKTSFSDESLLEYMTDSDTVLPSLPPLDASDVYKTHPQAASVSYPVSLGSIPTSSAKGHALPIGQGSDDYNLNQPPIPPWYGSAAEAGDGLYSLDWSWFLDELGLEYQSGDSGMSLGLLPV